MLLFSLLLGVHREPHSVGVAKASLDVSLLPDECQRWKAVAGLSSHAYQNKGAPTFQGLHARLHSSTKVCSMAQREACRACPLATMTKMRLHDKACRPVWAAAYYLQRNTHQVLQLGV